jgi:RNA polymerase sigma factor (sigma-70 family)
MPEMPQPADPRVGREKTISTGRSELVSDLFRANNRALISFLLTHLSNESEAHEVAQEGYVKLLQLDQPETISFLRSYLFRTAANLAIDRIRRQGCRERVESLALFEEWSQTPSVEHAVMAREEIALVRVAVGELKPKYQRAFLLHKFRERSINEVATDMDISPRMVRMYVARALFYCRLRLDGCEPDPARQAMMELQS